jgi:hypothetical protein
MAFQPTLQAAPDPLILDIEAGQTEGTTQVEYSKEPEQRIWHRWKPGAWLKAVLQVTAPDDPALSHGYLVSPKLAPGTVYQVAIWEADIDPNQLPNLDQPVRALAAITVFVLRKRPERRAFFSDENYTTGGTYRQHQVVTKSPVNVCMMVSTAAPESNAEGFLTFPHTDATMWASTNQSFMLQVTDLLPGTHYHELIRMSDEFGNWEFLQRDFATLKRRIRLKVTQLFINDDSDDFSNGEGSFLFALETGDISVPTSWAKRGKFTYHNGNLETGKAAVPVPPDTIEVGPEAVNQANRHVRFAVEGTEDDTDSFFPDNDDTAWGSKDLLLPTGTTDEVVSQRPDSIGADRGLGFSFTVSFDYWVDYF